MPRDSCPPNGAISQVHSLPTFSPFWPPVVFNVSQPVSTRMFWYFRSVSLRLHLARLMMAVLAFFGVGPQLRMAT